MRSIFVLVVSLQLLTSCNVPDRSPETENKIDIDFGNLTPETPEEESARRAANRPIVERFNRNAKATNIRLRDAYERGQKVCQNLRQAGLDDRPGCPRPLPNYVPLLKE
jgi:hypothetical protein